MKLFDKEFYKGELRRYYTEKYGEKDDDVWYDQPAVNVWVFGREDKIITLKSDIRTGEVEEFIDLKKI